MICSYRYLGTAHLLHWLTTTTRKLQLRKRMNYSIVKYLPSEKYLCMLKVYHQPGTKTHIDISHLANTLQCYNY